MVMEWNALQASEKKEANSTKATCKTEIELNKLVNEVSSHQMAGTNEKDWVQLFFLNLGHT